jgi:hypothetical protein
VVRWLYVVVIGAVLSGFAFLLFTGQYTNDGPVLVSVTGGHGLHEGDVFVIVGWTVSMAALLRLALSSRRHGAA